MSCGGKIPNSVALRVQAAGIAASMLKERSFTDTEGKEVGFGTVAGFVYDFIRGPLSSAEIDKEEPGHLLGPNAIKARQDFISAPCWDIACEAKVRQALRESGFVSTLSLLQQAPESLVAHHGLTAEHLASLREELAAHGLTLGMPAHAIHLWVIHGKDYRGHLQAAR